MQSQKSDAEIRIEEQAANYRKTQEYRTSIIGRFRLRHMRFILQTLDINMPIPMNSAAFTHEYCLMYGAKEPDNIFNILGNDL